MTSNEGTSAGLRDAARFAARFPGTLPAFDAAFASLRRALDTPDVVGSTRYKVELVFEEIVANIMRHAAPPGGTPEIDVALHARDESLVLTFEDDGPPFDPRNRENPALPKSLDQAQIGGLGILMVRRVASAIDYERTADARNRLTVTISKSHADASICQNAGTPNR